MLNHRQVVYDPVEANKIVFSGDVITLKHAESAGYVCYDDMSLKKEDQVYVRMYKGLDESERITTNCLFEVCQYYPDDQNTMQQLGEPLKWKQNQGNRLT